MNDELLPLPLGTVDNSLSEISAAENQAEAVEGRKLDLCISRRHFLKGTAKLGVAAMLLPLIESCVTSPSATPAAPSGQPGPPAPSPEVNGSTLAKEENIAQVALVKTSDRASGVVKAIDLLKSNPVDGQKITLKPNFNTADPAPGSTHNDTLRSLVTKLREMGSGDIVLAERSAGDTRTVMEQKGIFALAEDLGFEVLILNEMEPDGWVHLQPKDSHWKNGFHFARPYLEAECIVETCCLKTHGYGGHFTLSLKLAVGTLPGRRGFPYMSELHSSPHQRLMIAEINSVFTPALIVLDGVEAFTEGGPAVGKRVQANVMLAGADRVAIDAVGVAILRDLGTTPEVSRGNIFAQEQIARAVELGLGVDSPARIEIVTGNDESAAYAAKIRQVLDAG